MLLNMRLLFVYVFFLCSLPVLVRAAGPDSTTHLRVSLLTCGPGAEIYSVFGHTAVRIVDSVAKTDIVYNYGTFDGYDENFEMNFMRGKLLYYLSDESFDGFVSSYADERRWVDEQVLLVSPEDKRRIQAYLEQNLLPENRAYKYDFFFDNCATRVRDIFSNVGTNSFRFAPVVPAGGITFRQIINRYLAGVPWERFGINILLGSKIDRKMSNEDMMFLPDYLEDAVAGATLEGRPYVNAPQRIVTGITADSNEPGIQGIFWGMLLLLVAGLFIPKLRILGAFISSLLLIVTGLLGFLILFMWFGTDHHTCADNYNLLWAFPTNLIYVFKRKQTKYALIAIGGIFVSVLLHITGVQGLLLPDMLPLLLMLLITFAFDYRKYQNR